MKEIKCGNEILARLIHESDLREGLNFFSKNEESIQLGVWNYQSGIELKRHIHNKALRNVERTQEVLIILSGILEATIYDMEEHEIAKLELKQGDILILLDCGHGYRILSDNTRVIEIKNGPYLGAEIDRRRF